MTDEEKDRIAKAAEDRATREANLVNDVKNLKGEIADLKTWRLNFEDTFKKAIFRVFMAIWAGVLYIGSIVVEKLTAGWWPK